MVEFGIRICPDCGGDLVKYDRRKRIVRLGFGRKVWTTLTRFRCQGCRRYHREIPKNSLPFKQYDRRIVEGFRSGRLNTCMDAYEDYPCDGTIKNWKIA